MAGLACLALGVAGATLPWGRIAAALMQVEPAWAGVAVAANLLILPFWALQWQMLAQPFAPVPLAQMARVVAVSNGSKAAMSGAVGVASGFGALMAMAGLTPVAAGAVMAVDQVLAITMKLAVTAIALALAPLGGALVPLVVVWTGVAAGLVLVCAGVATGRIAALNRLRPALQIVASPRGVAALVLLSVIKKLTEVLAALAVQQACGMDAGLTGAVLVVAAVSLSTLVPVTPANLGTHSAAVAGVYLWLGFPLELAAVAGLVHHALVMASSVLILALTHLALLRHALPKPVLR